MSLMVDGVTMINDALAAGKRVMAEGAQGIMLDIDFGTYPYVTSSSPSPGGVCTGLGVSPRKIDKIIGIVKAYTTRVGEGPFPSEITGPQAEYLREQGGEYGATTGRPRRCGWFDAAVVRRGAQIAGIDELIVMKLDVLDTFEKIPVCAGYDLKGRQVDLLPLDCANYSDLRPRYIEMEGWMTPTTGVRKYHEFPAKTRAYIERLEDMSGCPITAVSVGPDREQTVTRVERFLP